LPADGSCARCGLFVCTRRCPLVEGQLLCEDCAAREQVTRDRTASELAVTGAPVVLALSGVVLARSVALDCNGALTPSSFSPSTLLVLGAAVWQLVRVQRRREGISLRMGVAALGLGLLVGAGTRLLH
jgi:hypothetical protein